MRNRLFAVFCFVAVAILAFSGGALGDSVIRVAVDGQVVETGGEVPLVRDGATFLPLRATGNALHCEVSWNGVYASVLGQGKEIRITPGARAAIVISNGEEKVVRVPQLAFVERGRTYVPFRFIAQALGMTAWWDDATLTANIETDIPYTGVLDERPAVYAKLSPKLQNIYDYVPGYSIDTSGGSLNFGEDRNIKVEEVGRDKVCITLPPQGESETVNQTVKSTLQVLLGDKTGRQVYEYKESLSFGSKVIESFGGDEVYFIIESSEYITIL